MAERVESKVMYRTAAGIAVMAALILIWLSLGVGIIGADGDPANLLYGGVLAIGIVGAVAARFRAEGMARVLAAMAAAQVVVGGLALAGGWGRDSTNWPLDILGLTAFFVVLWLLSAWLFRRAAAA